MTHRYQRDELWVGIIAGMASLAAFFFYFRHDALLFYGDAVAHINIARRIFDSRDPGPLQLGTVWLPLPHLLLLPLVISNWMWRTGVGGAIPSMAAYVAGAVGMFRLVASHVFGAEGFEQEQGGVARKNAGRAAAWCATVIYIANPNLLYLQATAMNEPLYMALFIWATVYFSEFVEQMRCHPIPLAKTGQPATGWATRALRNGGILLLLAMLTRYDGWFAGAVFAVAAAVVFARARSQSLSGAVRESGTRTNFALNLLPLPLTQPGLRKFLLIVAAVPVLWLGYNAAVWGTPLEFATGPYSAKAIERRTATLGMQHHPGYHNVPLATLYFLKDAKLNLADGRWQALWLPLATLGAALMLIAARRRWPLLLLWAPLPFYALAMAHGGVPLFLPEWWPYSYYNVRYGLQLMPAIAVSVAVVLWFVMDHLRRPPWRVAAIVAVVALIAGSYASAWRSEPICLREARTNSATRLPFTRQLGRALLALPADATVLMSTTTYVGALQQAGIPLRRTINETTHPFWKQALADPAAYTDFAVAIGNDAVAGAIAAEAARFQPIVTIEAPGQPRAIIFRRK